MWIIFKQSEFYTRIQQHWWFNPTSTLSITILQYQYSVNASWCSLNWHLNCVIVNLNPCNSSPKDIQLLSSSANFQRPQLNSATHPTQDIQLLSSSADFQSRCLKLFNSSPFTPSPTADRQSAVCSTLPQYWKSHLSPRSFEWKRGEWR